MNALEKITKARAGLILDQPFFGALALRMAVNEDPSCQTGHTDGVTLGFNPAFINELSLDQTKGFLAHEVMHIATAHHARRGHRDHKKWNLAGDMAINTVLKSSGFTLPEGAVYGDGDKSAEQYYSEMPEPEQGDGAGQGEGDQNQDPGGCGEVRDSPGQDGQPASPADLEQAAQEAKVAVIQAATQAKAMGSLTGGIARMVEELLNPKADWKEILRRFVETNAKNDYSWTPPNRRFVHLGIYLPSLRSQELGEIVVAVDTSGSISRRHVDQFAGEITGLLEEFDTTATVIYCDTKIAGVETFTKQDLPLELNPQGSGGTDFRPPFDWVDEQGKAPACMIYLTDLHCSRYPDDPSYPVLWAHIGTGGGETPFGEVIELD